MVLLRLLLAGAERGSCVVLQIALNFRCERVRTTKHTPRGPLRLLERGHGLAQIVERGAVVFVEHPSVKPSRGRVLYATTGPSTFQGSSATGPLNSYRVVTGRPCASSTPLLGDAARRRRRSWPGRATNVFFRMLWTCMLRPSRRFGPTPSPAAGPEPGPMPGRTPTRRPGPTPARRRPTADPTQGWGRSPTD